MAEVPVLLTVEEAGELLRIGRTKAYAMTREWRETNGASGLPVVDLGNVLRVPRKALEQLIGADLSSVNVQERHGNGLVEGSTALATRPCSKSRKASIPQPDLFNSSLDTEAS